MPKYIFEMKVEITEVANVKNLIVIEADTQEQAVRSARANTLDWWGVPTGEVVGTLEWEYDRRDNPSSWILADPTYKGVFTDEEIEILRRATTVLNNPLLSDDKIIALIEDRQDNGMPRPSTEMLKLLFGEEFAARCAVQLEG